MVIYIPNIFYKDNCVVVGGGAMFSTWMDEKHACI